MAAAGAVGTASDEQRRELQKLEAIELLMRRRSRRARSPSAGDELPRLGHSAPRHLDVRALLEQGGGRRGLQEGGRSSTTAPRGSTAAQVFDRRLRASGRSSSGGEPEHETDSPRQLGRDQGGPGLLRAARLVSKLGHGRAERGRATSTRWLPSSSRTQALGERQRRRQGDEAWKLAKWAAGLKERQKTVAEAMKKSNLVDLGRTDDARTPGDDEARKAAAELAAHTRSSTRSGLGPAR